MIPVLRTILPSSSLRCRSAAERLLGSWVRIPPAAWMFVLYSVCVVRGLYGGPIPHPEEFYLLWCVPECAQVKNKTLDTCCEQVKEIRTTKRNETELPSSSK
jgi:hypothetical protein